MAWSISEIVAAFAAMQGAAIGAALFIGKRWVDHRLATESAKEIEGYKQQLSQLSEQLKYDLQKQIITAQLHTSQKYEVYPRLYELLRHAEGAVGGLYGFRFAPTWTEFDVSDFDRMLRRRKLVTTQRKKLLAEISADREAGIQAMEKYLHEISKMDARRAIDEARNYRILKSPHLSPAVRASAIAVHDKLWNAWVDLTTDGLLNGLADGKKALDEASALMASLEEMLSRELSPAP